jgi:hypothetical protein
VPFYPALFAPLLALLAGGLMLLRPRLGLAFALAVPVLPLGNVSSGLALLYAALACAWLALSWRVAAAGPLPRARPSCSRPCWRWASCPWQRRESATGRDGRCRSRAAVLLAATRRRSCGTRRFRSRRARAPKGLGIAGSDQPFAVAMPS